MPLRRTSTAAEKLAALQHVDTQVRQRHAAKDLECSAKSLDPSTVLSQECSQTCCQGLAAGLAAAQPAAGEPIPVALVEHVQLFRVKCSRQKKWHTEIQKRWHTTRTFEIDNSTRWVRANMINIYGGKCEKLKCSA